VRAELSTTLGEVYTGLGLYNSAFELLTRAGAISDQNATSHLRQTVALGELEFQRGNDARAAAVLQHADQFATRGMHDVASSLRARILLDRGDVAAFMERADEARGFFGQALKIGKRYRLDDVTMRALEGIALADYYAGDVDRARHSYETALAERIKHSGETHPKVSESLTALGSIAYAQGRSADAESYWLRSLAVDERILGPNHPDVAVTLNNLGRLDVERRNFARAKQRLARAVDIYEVTHSETHEGRIFAWTNLALADIGLAEVEPARKLLERALSAASTTRHRLEGPILTDLADLECRSRNTGEGLARLAVARPMVAERYPDDAWRVALVDNVRAGCLARIGRSREAVPLIESSTSVVLAKWPAATYYGHDTVQRATQVYTVTGNRARLAQLGIR
jgi:tetratricopeptide (TPR) repeat protein